MLYRKISSKIEGYLRSGSDKMLVVDGARQVGKSYIIRYVGKKVFANFIEINMELDKQKDRIFEKVLRCRPKTTRWSLLMKYKLTIICSH